MPATAARRAERKRFLHGPQSACLPMRGLDQDQARRIETESAEAVTMQPAEGAEPVARHDEEEGRVPCPSPLVGEGREGGREVV